MHEYYPIVYTDSNKNMLLLDTTFAVNEFLNYAIKHNMSVKFTDTTSTMSVETIYKFVKHGFYVMFDEEERHAPDGIELEPRVVVYLNKILEG